MMSWIKLRSEFPTCRKMLRLQSALGCSLYESIGIAITWLCWVDMNCETGDTRLTKQEFESLFNLRHANNVTRHAENVTDGAYLEEQCHAQSVTNIAHLTKQSHANCVTRHANCVTYPVFEAMQHIGWIDLDENGEVLIVDFEKHNGQCAKKRAQGNNRKQRQRCHAESETRHANCVTQNEQISDSVSRKKRDQIREDKIREDNNNISISLKETSSQSNYVNNNTTVLSDVKSETAENALKTAFSTSDDKMFGTREETPNKPISVANKANSAQPCGIINIYSYLGTHFPDFTSDEQDRIVSEFFDINERENWQNVSNWKLSLQRLIQSKYVRA